MTTHARKVAGSNPTTYLVLFVRFDFDGHCDDSFGHPGEEEERRGDAVTHVKTSRTLDRDVLLTRAVTQRDAVDDADDHDDEDWDADEQENLFENKTS